MYIEDMYTDRGQCRFINHELAGIVVVIIWRNLRLKIIQKLITHKILRTITEEKREKCIRFILTIIFVELFKIA